MTLDTSVSKAVFQGNGSAVAFPFSFRVWNAAELIVQVTGADGMARDVTAQCSIALSDDGGTVTYAPGGAPLPAGHTLVIHSRDAEVIRQFALKKPVARLLVNTPAALGGMGATTELFPAMTLGSGLAGQGITSDNVSPMNLVYIRRVGYGTRRADDVIRLLGGPGGGQRPAHGSDINLDALRQVLRETLRVISAPERN